MAHTVLLLSRGFVHPSLLVRRRVRRLVRSSLPKDVKLETRSSLKHLSRVDAHAPAAVVLLYHEKLPPAGVVDALDAFLRAGGGVLALHASLASFQDEPRYADILGGAFTGHGKPGPIRVSPSTTSGGRVAASDAEAAGSASGAIPSSGVIVTDELYRMSLREDIRVRAVGETLAKRPGGDHARPSTGDEDGWVSERQAICWERPHGRGLVAAVTLGHYGHIFTIDCIRGLINEELQRVLARGRS